MDNKIIAVAAVVVILIAGVGAYFVMSDNGGDDGDKPTLVVTGSTTVNPVMSAVAEVYVDANLQVGGTGSGQGASDTINGTANIGMLSRDLKQSEIDSGLRSITIGKDAVGVIVGSNAGVENLTTEQLSAIYKGEITNWSQVGGNNQAIAPIVREAGSGTRDCFDEALGLTKTDMTSFGSADSNGNVVKRVEAAPGAIGYIGLAYLEGLSDKAVEISVNGVKASVETINDYDITRNLILATLGEPDAEEQALLDYMLSPAGQKIVEEQGFVPIAPTS